ncbi:MAG: hypothetical protein SH817_04760 [Leptospira sp.]|nr:hypothetical protein [Leptospira sp.]
MKICILLISILSFHCIAFKGNTKEDIEIKKLNLKKINLVFTGFHYYLEQQTLIESKLLSNGYVLDKESNLLIEIILEDISPIYSYPKLHFLNLIGSILTATMLPYHNISNHKLKVRIRDLGEIVYENNRIISLHQYRGILLIPLTPFYWPSFVFNDSLLMEFDKLLRSLNEV